MIGDVRLRPLDRAERARHVWLGRDEHVAREVASGRFGPEEAECEATRLAQLYGAAIRDSPDENPLFAIELEGSSVGTAWLTVVPDAADPQVASVMVRKIHLDAAHQGAGIEERVIGLLVEEARVRGCDVPVSEVFASDPVLLDQLERSGFTATSVTIETTPRCAGGWSGGRLHMRAEAMPTDGPTGSEQMLTLEGATGRAVVRVGDRWHGRTLHAGWVNLEPSGRPHPLLEAILAWGANNGCTKVVLTLSTEDVPLVSTMRGVDWRLVSRWLVRVPDPAGHQTQLVTRSGWRTTSSWQCSCGAEGGPYSASSEAEAEAVDHYLGALRP